MDATQLARICEHANGTGFNPVLNALHIYATPTGNRAQAGNGRYILDMPTDLPTMTTPAGKLLAALRACKGEPRLEVDGPNLLVKSGRVRVKLPLLDAGSYPVSTPDEAGDDLPEGIGALFKRVLPFVASDASRPWATSVCLRDGFAYATNNVVLCRLPFPFPHPQAVNIPVATVEAIIEHPNPTRLGFSASGLTFYYADGTWLKTNLVEGSWPADVVNTMLADADARTWQPLDPELAGHLATAAKLADDRHPVAELAGANLATVDGAFAVEELVGLPGTPAKLNAKMAALTLGAAREVCWHAPKPDAHLWRDGTLLGVLGGVR